MSQLQKSRSPTFSPAPRSSQNQEPTSESMQATELRRSKSQSAQPRRRTGPRTVGVLPVSDDPNEPNFRWGSHASRLTNLTFTPARLNRLASNEPSSTATAPPGLNVHQIAPQVGTSSLERDQTTQPRPTESAGISSGSWMVDYDSETSSDCVPSDGSPSRQSGSSSLGRDRSSQSRSGDSLGTRSRSRLLDYTTDTSSDRVPDTKKSSKLPLADCSSSQSPSNVSRAPTFERSDSGIRQRKDAEPDASETSKSHSGQQNPGHNSSDGSSSLRSGQQYSGSHAGLTSGESAEMNSEEKTGSRSRPRSTTDSPLVRPTDPLPTYSYKSKSRDNQSRSESRPKSSSSRGNDSSRSGGVSGPHQQSSDNTTTSSEPRSKNNDPTRLAEERAPLRSEDAAVDSAKSRPRKNPQLVVDPSEMVATRTQSGARSAPQPSINEPAGRIMPTMSVRVRAPKRPAAGTSSRSRKDKKASNEPTRKGGSGAAAAGPVTSPARKTPGRAGPSRSGPTSPGPSTAPTPRERRVPEVPLPGGASPPREDTRGQSAYHEPYESALLSLIVETQLDELAKLAEYDERYNILAKKYLEPPASIPDKKLQDIQREMAALHKKLAFLRGKHDRLKAALRQSVSDKLASGRSGPYGPHARIKEIYEECGKGSSKCMTQLRVELSRQALLPEKDTDQLLVRQIEADLIWHHRNATPSDFGSA